MVQHTQTDQQTITGLAAAAGWFLRRVLHCFTSSKFVPSRDEFRQRAGEHPAVAKEKGDGNKTNIQSKVATEVKKKASNKCDHHQVQS
jgi:hypothetical protein